MSALDVRLLKALRAAGLHCPGSELAAQTGATLADVEVRIAELSHAGFQIENRPGFGYRLLNSPDRLIADDLWARLGEHQWLRDIIVYDQTDSTNDRAAHLGREGVAGGVAIFAEKQSAGRGRFGRRWDSGSHLGLWFSILLRPALPLALWPRITTCAAVSIAAAIERQVPLQTRIKWPNDVQIRGRKVAGILMETGLDTSRVPFAVLGIGLNANQQPEQFPEELRTKATSLSQEAGHLVDRAALAVAIFEELQARWDLLASGFDVILSEAQQRSDLFGRWIQLRAGQSLIEGIAEGLDSEGHLRVRDRAGVLHVLSGGEVTVVGK